MQGKLAELLARDQGRSFVDFELKTRWLACAPAGTASRAGACMCDMVLNQLLEEWIPAGSS
jgi:hypothetical protein